MAMPLDVPPTQPARTTPPLLLRRLPSRRTPQALHVKKPSKNGDFHLATSGDHKLAVDTDGVPVTTGQAKAIIADRWTVPPEVRARRRSQKPRREGPSTSPSRTRRVRPPKGRRARRPFPPAILEQHRGPRSRPPSGQPPARRAGHTPAPLDADTYWPVEARPRPPNAGPDRPAAPEPRTCAPPPGTPGSATTGPGYCSPEIPAGNSTNCATPPPPTWASKASPCS
jgi:hypothetical protein